MDLSWISCTKGDLAKVSSPSFSFNLWNSLWISSERRFTRRSWALNESLAELNDKVSCSRKVGVAHLDMRALCSTIGHVPGYRPRCSHPCVEEWVVALRARRWSGHLRFGMLARITRRWTFLRFHALILAPKILHNFTPCPRSLHGLVRSQEHKAVCVAP
ncbi:hypothetical protein B296_00044911 [Ensete ventricosum]|uniref:Uncharacterized protein n=1 Tax=Ensete ventricosum TaxID=4639 RepID=A0A426XHE5_ENSVE|nr:hypothetical protein B296_00044911 [Ensete ventricosum]